MRAPTLLPIWLHDHDYGRNAGGADCSAALWRLFLLATRDFGDRVLRVLVLREFSIHRHVHGGRSGAGIAAGRFGGSRLGNLVRAAGIVDAGPEDRRGDARDWVDGNGRGSSVAGVADVPERASRGECPCGGVGTLRTVFVASRCVFNLTYFW